MIHLNDIVNNFDLNYCVYRQGFVFTAIHNPTNVFNGIVIRNPVDCDCWSPKKSFSEHTLNEHISLINNHKLEKATIIAEDIHFITQCPTLKYIEITPADSAKDNFDYSPLYKMPEIKYLMCKTRYGGIDEKKKSCIDYSRISGLKELWADGDGHLNVDRIEGLENLHISANKIYTDLTSLSYIDTLRVLDFTSTKLTSLSGISKLKNLECLSLHYNRTLRDLSELSNVSSSLRTLCIDNCNNISDFSFLNDLVDLEELYLLGKNELKDLRFLGAMKKLNRFTFSMKISNGDLAPCLSVPYVCSLNDRRHYNIKDKDLPKQDVKCMFYVF